jgi:hypothetical protein
MSFHLLIPFHLILQLQAFSSKENLCCSWLALLFRWHFYEVTVRDSTVRHCQHVNFPFTFSDSLMQFHMCIHGDGVLPQGRDPALVHTWSSPPGVRPRQDLCPEEYDQ